MFCDLVLFLKLFPHMIHTVFSNFCYNASINFLFDTFKIMKIKQEILARPMLALCVMQ